MLRVIGLGAGGHAKVVIDILSLIGDFDIVGLLDPKRDLWGTELLGVPVLGSDELLSEIQDQGVSHAFIGLGGSADTNPRRQLYEMACGRGLKIVNAVHPRAIIASSAEIGKGPTVLAGAVINAAARLGDNVIVNTGAIVEHDCAIGNHVHIATGARLASTVEIGSGAHIGAGATVRQGIAIGEGALVGAGAVVVNDVSPNTVVVGVPAHPMGE
jgi:UDP-perosamine 4-acetyltransferase